MATRCLRLSRTTYVCLWWVFLLFQVANVAFLIMLAIVYANYPDPIGVLNKLTNAFMFSSSQRYLQVNYAFISAGYGLLALLFVNNGMCMLRFSTKRRDFSFGPGKDRAQSVVNHRLPSQSTVQPLKNKIRALLISIRIGGENCTALMLVLETIVEIFPLSAQGYQLSKNVS